MIILETTYIYYNAFQHDLKTLFKNELIADDVIRYLENAIDKNLYIGFQDEEQFVLESKFVFEKDGIRTFELYYEIIDENKEIVKFMRLLES